ncbi:MAG: hypothetical protein KDK08_29925, partial [Rhizobiaceae bacterium]|nr:hypothetical protein [Rhizobiaceae bacterium]
MAEGIGGDVNYRFGFDSQGTQLAGVSKEDDAYRVGIWRTKGGKDWFPAAPCEADIRFPRQIWPVSAMVWHPDGTQLAQASFDGSIRIWDVSDGAQLAAIDSTTSSPVKSMDWNSQSSLLAAAGDDGIVRIVAPNQVTTQNLNQPTTLPILLRGHTSRIEALKWRRDGAMIATGGADESIRVWEMKEPAILKASLPDSGAMPRLQWGVYPEQLTAMLSGHLATWNVNNGSVLAHVYGMQILDSYDGRYRAILAQEREYIEEYGNEGTELFPIELAYGGPDTSLHSAWSDSCNEFAFASPSRLGHSLKIVSFAKEPESPQTSEVLECDRLYAIAWHPFQKWIAVSYYSSNSDGRKRVVIIDVTTASILHEVQFAANQIHSFAWSPQGEFLAMGGDDGVIKIFDMSERQIIKVLEGHTRDVRALAWHPGGDRLASGSDDRTLKIWDVSGGRIAASFAH